MLGRVRPLVAVVAGVLLAVLAPGSAHAQDQVLTDDVSAAEVEALDGVVAWSRLEAPARFRLVLRRGGVTADAPGVPWSSSPFAADLGLDQQGRLVAAYQRCRAERCRWRIYDVASGREREPDVPVARGCRLTGLALWGDLTVSARECRPRRGSGVLLHGPTGTQRLFGATAAVPSNEENMQPALVVDVDLAARRVLAEMQVGDADVVWLLGGGPVVCRRVLGWAQSEGEYDAWLTSARLAVFGDPRARPDVDARWLVQVDGLEGRSSWLYGTSAGPGCWGGDRQAVRLPEPVTSAAVDMTDLEAGALYLTPLSGGVLRRPFSLGAATR